MLGDEGLQQVPSGGLIIQRASHPGSKRTVVNLGVDGAWQLCRRIDQCWHRRGRQELGDEVPQLFGARHRRGSAWHDEGGKGGQAVHLDGDGRSVRHVFVPPARSVHR